MAAHIWMRLLVLWCLGLQVVDCWTTYQLAGHYGWEGELNQWVVGFISQSVFHLIALKLFVVLPGLYIYSILWDDGEYEDYRHTWAVRIMFAFDAFATGLILHNVLMYRALLGA